MTSNCPPGLIPVAKNGKFFGFASPEQIRKFDDLTPMTAQSESVQEKVVDEKPAVHTKQTASTPKQETKYPINKPKNPKPVDQPAEKPEDKKPAGSADPAQVRKAPAK